MNIKQSQLEAVGVDILVTSYVRLQAICTELEEFKNQLYLENP